MTVAGRTRDRNIIRHQNNSLVIWPLFFFLLGGLLVLPLHKVLFVIAFLAHAVGIMLLVFVLAVDWRFASVSLATTHYTTLIELAKPVIESLVTKVLIL